MQGAFLQKVFSGNNMKVSYACMENTAQIVKGHNSKFYKGNRQKLASFVRPLNRSFLQSGIVYKDSSQSTSKKTYIGLPESEFKSRLNNHITSFSHKRHSLETALRR